MQAYIQILSDVMMTQHALKPYELREIGGFNRENVLAWLNRHTNTDWVGLLPPEDFHAVCGNIDIPWATEEAKSCFERVWGIPAR